jgi:hypothetical protein
MVKWFCDNGQWQLRLALRIVHGERHIYAITGFERGAYARDLMGVPRESGITEGVRKK